MASSKTQQVVALSLLCMLLVAFSYSAEAAARPVTDVAGAVANDARQECIQKCKSLGGVCLCRPAPLQGCCCCWQ
ncbi:hypothetical protein C5167_032353 [Papaver somniferum]|uniref:Invertebrate defensins family profile domain-containing protein n=1 Tax=Papaver somniferum TaxID=3469 RepID=A0A4Y7K9A3_PAPSO|nr:hypothetical protein C5167_032353 [Papaver somniferum]